METENDDLTQILGGRHFATRGSAGADGGGTALGGDAALGDDAAFDDDADGGGAAFDDGAERALESLVAGSADAASSAGAAALGDTSSGRAEAELDRTILRPWVLQEQTDQTHAPRPQQPSDEPPHEPHVPTSTRNRPARKPGKPRHGCLAALLWPIVLLIVAFAAIRMLPADLASGHFVPEAISIIPWLIVPAALILVPALVWHRSLLAPLTATVLALLLWWHAGYFIPSGSLSPAARGASTPGAEPSTDDAVMRIMTLNAYNGHASAEEIVACVRENNIELLALQEVSWSFLDELAYAGIYDVLPYQASSDPGEWDNGGLNCLFSLAPLYDVSSDLLPTELSALCAGTVEVGGRDLRFVSCHPSSPHLGGERLWSSGLETIGSLSEYDHTYVIMGDFNSTWNHARFRELLGESFVDASQQAGEGFHMTWPADLEIAAGSLPVPRRLSKVCPPLIEIDHIVYAADAGVFVGGFKTVRISGTDHMALIATLEVG